MIYTTKYPYDKLVHTTIIKFKIKLKLNCFFFSFEKCKNKYHEVTANFGKF